MSVCKGCGQEIRWIRMPSGKAMPVDDLVVNFIPAGGPDTFITVDGRTVRGRKPTWQEIESHIAMPGGYTPHWSTCPAAGHFKKGGGERDQG